MGVHTPSVQPAFNTFGVCAHWLPQAPQLEVLEFVSVSQPVLPVSQCMKPALQAHWQAPATQEGVPFVVEQTVPHLPQFLMSVAVSVAQP